MFLLHIIQNSIQGLKEQWDGFFEIYSCFIGFHSQLSLFAIGSPHVLVPVLPTCWFTLTRSSIINKYEVLIAGAKVQFFILLLFLHVLFFLCFCIFYLFAFLRFLLFLCINSWPLGSGFVRFSRFTLSCISTLFCIFWLLHFYSISFCMNSWRWRVFISVLLYVV